MYQLFSIAVISNRPKSNLGRQGLFSLELTVSPSRREVKEATRRNELKLRPWRNAAYWLAPQNLLSFLIQARILPRGSTTHSGLGPLTLIIN